MINIKRELRYIGRAMRVPRFGERAKIINIRGANRGFKSAFIPVSERVCYIVYEAFGFLPSKAGVGY